MVDESGPKHGRDQIKQHQDVVETLKGLTKDLRGEALQRTQSLIVRGAAGKEISIELFNVNAGTRRPALWRLRSQNGVCNLLAPRQQVSDFLMQALGSKPIGLGARSETTEVQTPVKKDSPKESSPEKNTPPEKFDFNFLFTRANRLFGNGPLGVQHVALEINGEIQGFMSIEKRAQRFALVDDLLGRRIGLYSDPRSKDHVREWLKEDYSVEPSVCVFRLASKEEKDAYESQEREDATAEVLETLPDEVSSVPETFETEASPTEDLVQVEQAPEETVPNSDESPVPSAKQKPKRVHPKNRPKKKTRAQEKAKQARLDGETYVRITESCRKIAEKLFAAFNPNHMYSVLDQLSELGSMSGENKSRLRKDLDDNPAFAQLRLFLSLYRHEGSFSKSLINKHSIASNTSREQKFDALKRVIALAKELFPDEALQNPYLNPEAAGWAFQRDSRNAREYYALMFRDRSPEEFVAWLGTLRDEQWVDIGSGRTPENSDSLIRVLPFVNKTIKMIGVDPSYYDDGRAPQSDRVRGRVGRTFEGAEACDLRPGYAQDLPLETKSTHRVISNMVFDKFNDAPAFQGTQQALREIARILENGGEARIRGIRASEVERRDSVIHTYFELDPEEIEDMKYSLFESKEKFVYIRLVRKQASDADEKRLLDEIDEWKRTHV